MSIKLKTVTEYIAAAPKGSQKKLREMRAILKKAAPKAEESIKWGTAAFSYERILFTYAGFKQHIGFYPTPSAIRAFKKELKNYKTAKGSIQFPFDTPLPKSLITKIAKFRVKELREKDAKWM
jgi:uncharacterized protein YdhG (YjbR/CyaY superfamily)